jgi:hypothetical protein
MITSILAAHEVQPGMYLDSVDGIRLVTDYTTGLGLIESVREPRDDVELTVWGETKMFTINVGRDTPVGIARG